MEPAKTVKVGDQECVVQTLREWLNDRITMLRREKTHSCDYNSAVDLSGRLTELLIIREKINDGRIQEIQ